jgi:Gaa1-like, GPI transamidase component
MLRYKIYVLVTHPKFPDYAFVASLVLYLAGIYALVNPSFIAVPAFISENAVSPSYQVSHIENYVSSSSFKEFNNWNNTDIYYTYVKSPRTPGKDCIGLIFSYGSTKIGLSLAISLKRYMESQNWGGDLLIILYKPQAYAESFRDWMDKNAGKFGVIRCFFYIDIDQTSSYLSVSGDGLNGIQTDLDQFFAVIKLLQKTQVELKYPLPLKSPLPSLSASLSSWKEILEGNVDSPHAYLINSGYLATRIFSVSNNKSKNTNTANILKFLEILVRTFTGLDENLHAGYYFYYFSGPTSMMPLSKYAYIILSLILPLIFQAILTLREEWWDYNGLKLLVMPYITGYLAYALALTDCNKPFLVYPIFLIGLNLLLGRSGKVFKAYANLSLGTSIAIMSIRNFPVSLMLSALVPLRIVLPCCRATIIYSILVIGFGIGASFSYLGQLAKIESCSGHHLLYYALCIFNPCVWHIIYLFR